MAVFLPINGTKPPANDSAATAVPSEASAQAPHPETKPEPPNQDAPRPPKPKMKRSGGMSGPFGYAQKSKPQPQVKSGPWEAANSAPATAPAKNPEADSTVNPATATAFTPGKKSESTVPLPAYASPLFNGSTSATNTPGSSSAKVARGGPTGKKLADHPLMKRKQDEWESLQGRPPRPVVSDTNGDSTHAGESTVTPEPAAKGITTGTKGIIMATKKRPYTVWYNENGEEVDYEDLLIPKHYKKDYTFPGCAWICPVRDCRICHASAGDLAQHFKRDHFGEELNDNRDGTFSVAADTQEGPPIVVSKNQIGPDAPPPVKPTVHGSFAEEREDEGREEPPDDDEEPWGEDEPTRIGDEVEVAMDVAGEDEDNEEESEAYITSDVSDEIETSGKPPPELTTTPSGRPYNKRIDEDGNMSVTFGVPIPDHYELHESSEYPWICPVRSCRTMTPAIQNLGSHFSAKHRGLRLNDNLDGTLSEKGAWIITSSKKQRPRSVIVSQNQLDPNEPPMARPCLPAQRTTDTKSAEASMTRRESGASIAAPSLETKTPQRPATRRSERGELARQSSTRSLSQVAVASDLLPPAQDGTANSVDDDPYDFDSLKGDANALWKYIKPLLNPSEFRTPKPPNNAYLPQLMDLARKRDIEWNEAVLSEWPFFIGQSKDISSIVVQLTGEPAKEPCRRCQQGHGPYKGCITIAQDAPLLARLGITSCANCCYHGNQNVCDLKTASLKRALEELPEYVFEEISYTFQQAMTYNPALCKVKNRVEKMSKDELAVAAQRNSESRASPSAAQVAQAKTTANAKSKMPESPTVSSPLAPIELTGNARDLWAHLLPHLPAIVENKLPLRSSIWIPELLTWPAVRSGIEWNTPWYEKNGFTIVLKTDVLATLLHLTGVPASAPCHYCAQGLGPFQDCTVVPDTANETIRNVLSGCANCTYKSGKARCQFYVKQDRYKPSVTLEDVSQPPLQPRSRSSHPFASLPSLRTSMKAGETATAAATESATPTPAIVSDVVAGAGAKKRKFGEDEDVDSTNTIDTEGPRKRLGMAQGKSCEKCRRNHTRCNPGHLAANKVSRKPSPACSDCRQRHNKCDPSHLTSGSTCVAADAPVESEARTDEPDQPVASIINSSSSDVPMADRDHHKGSHKKRNRLICDKCRANRNGLQCKHINPLGAGNVTAQAQANKPPTSVPAVQDDSDDEDDVPSQVNSSFKEAASAPETREREREARREPERREEVRREPEPPAPPPPRQSMGYLMEMAEWEIAPGHRVDAIGRVCAFGTPTQSANPTKLSNGRTIQVISLRAGEVRRFAADAEHALSCFVSEGKVWVKFDGEGEEEFPIGKGGVVDIRPGCAVRVMNRLYGMGVVVLYGCEVEPE